MTIDKSQISCPTCSQKNTWSTTNPFRPFCSERCKLIDLGEWAGEAKRLPGEPVDPHCISDKDKE